MTSTDIEKLPRVYFLFTLVPTRRRDPVAVWAPVREKNLGPHKVMTYVGESWWVHRQKIFEFNVSEMEFPAFFRALLSKI